MAQRFHIPILVSPDNPTACTVQVAKAPLSLQGATDADGKQLPEQLTEVEIELWEADRDLPDGGNTDDLLGTFIVDLSLSARGTVLVVERDFYTSSKGGDEVELGVLEVRLDLGDGSFGPTHRMPILAHQSEWPHRRPGWSRPRATTELAVTVKSGEFPDETTRAVVDLIEQGLLPGGPVAAFICMENPASTGAVLAREYWAEHADVVVATGEPGFDGSLRAVAEEIKRLDKVYQEINVIAHGTEEGMMLFARAGDAEHGSDAGWHSNHALVVDRIGKLVTGSAVLSREHSRVVIRGCTVGRDRRLLRSLSASLGRVRVYGAADKVLYLYRPPGGEPEYYVLTRYFTPVPGHVASTYLASAQRTAALLSADPHHPSGVDFGTFASRREDHWERQGVLPRFFRTARQMTHTYSLGGLSSRQESRDFYWDDVRTAVPRLAPSNVTSSPLMTRSWIPMALTGTRTSRPGCPITIGL